MDVTRKRKRKRKHKHKTMCGAITDLGADEDAGGDRDDDVVVTDGL